MSRERSDRLLALLEEYRTDTASQGGGLGGTLHDDAILLSNHDPHCQLNGDLRRVKPRCTCWRQSLDELRRALAALKQTHPVHHAHLVARHLQHERTQRNVWFRNGRYQTAPNERVVYPDLAPGRTPPTREYQATVITWRPWVDLLIVAQALELLATEFRGEIRLPDLQREAA